MARQTRRRTRNNVSNRHHTPIALIVLLALLHVCATSDDFTLKQVFDAIDSNHDHSISENEFTSATNNLIRGVASVGGADGHAIAAEEGGKSSVVAPAPQASAHPDQSGSIGASEQAKFDNPASTTAFLKALFASFSAIMATEIGDKTFFIAAILSMRNDRAAVFGGAILALIVMTILSTLMGLVLPALIPKRYTHIIGGVLFLYFGGRLLFDSRGMEDKVSEELEEVEEELAEINKRRDRARKNKQAQAEDDGAVTSESDVEGGVLLENGDGSGRDVGAKKRRGGAGVSGGGNKTKAPRSGMTAAGSYSGASWEAVFLQALTMTFLAEWGDRSQIATIALAAAKVRDKHGAQV